MKVYVIGTSNSVMGRNGFIKALGFEHEVVSLSIGRAPIFMHISEIIKHYSEIEASDLLIIDHASNYSFFEALGNSYKDHLENFYNILSSINIPVLVIVFPLMKINQVYEDYISFLNMLISNKKVLILDTNKLSLPPDCYRDNAHLSKELSFILGLAINSALNIAKVKKVSGGVIYNNPYSLIDVKELGLEKKLKEFETSILKKKYIEVDEELILSLERSECILAIGYVCTGVSGFIINNRKYLYSDNGYFIEPFSNQVKHNGVLKIDSISDARNADYLMPRPNFSYEKIEKLKLVCLFKYDEIKQFKYLHKNEKGISDDFIDVVIKIVKQLVSLRLEVNPGVVDVLRDIAIKIKVSNPVVALDLLKIAKLYRPTGPTIIDEIAKLEKKES